MDIKDKNLYCWNDELANHVIHEKYLRAKKVLEGSEHISTPYPPCHRLMGDNYYYYKDVQRKISIYNKSR